MGTHQAWPDLPHHHLDRSILQTLPDLTVDLVEATPDLIGSELGGVVADGCCMVVVEVKVGSGDGVGVSKSTFM